MHRIGSEITSLTRSTFTTGIQRVMVETHKHIRSQLNFQNESFTATSIDFENLGIEYLQNSYLSNDILLKEPITSISEIDTLLLLDSSLILPYGEILKERRRRSLKVVSVIHDILPILYPDFFPQDYAKNHYRRFIQTLFHISDLLIFESESVKNEVESLDWKFKGKSVVVRLGAHHEEEFIPFQMRPPLSMMYVSTLEPRKGHSQLLDAFDELLISGYDVYLTFIGIDGWKVDNLVNRILTHPEFNHRLRWLKKCGEDDLIHEYRNHSISINPSKAEGFGLNVEEALFFGQKVVANAIPVFLERSQPNLYFYDGSTADLVGKIVETSKFPYKSIGTSKIRHMRDYSSELLNNIRSLHHV